MKINYKKGFTLVEIMIVVAIIGIVIAIAVPAFLRAREQSRATACQENLAKIDGSKEQWALEKKKAHGTAVTMAELLDPDSTAQAGDGYLKTEPFCPAANNVAYTVNSVGTDPACPVYNSADPFLKLHILTPPPPAAPAP